MDWNLIVTIRPGPGFQGAVLGALSRFGRFRRTQFPDVCMGRVEELGTFLEALRGAIEAHSAWAMHIGRVIPAEQVFTFTPENIATQLKQAVGPLVERMSEGSFCIRLERRGLIGELKTSEIEADVADRVTTLCASRGVRLAVDLKDPDFLIAAETLGHECGVSLLPRALRQRYPFLQTR